MKSDFEENKEREIYRFFCISKIIHSLHKRKQQLDLEFHSRSFAPWIEFGELGVRNVGVNVEREVVTHVSALQVIDWRIKILRYEQHHFNRFLESLAKDERTSLVLKYSFQNYHNQAFTDIDEYAYEEIQEIKESLMYRYGIWFDKNSQVWNEEEVTLLLEQMRKEVMV